MEVWDRLNMVADVIENNPDDFNQESYGGGDEGFHASLRIPENVGGVFPHAGTGECGTPCCVAGWTITLFGNREEDASNVISCTAIEHYAYSLLNPEGHQAGHHLGQIFKAHWPAAWFKEGERIELARQRGYELITSMIPHDEEAVNLLRRLAIQIKEDCDAVASHV